MIKTLPPHLSFGCGVDADDALRLHRFTQVYPSMRRSEFLSKRTYEYFCTKYLRITDRFHKSINLSASYIEHAKNEKFAFFCRNNEPVFSIRSNDTDKTYMVNTSLLNFLNWVAMYDVDEYILDNQKDIQLQRMAHEMMKFETKTRSKRFELGVTDNNEIGGADNDDDMSKLLRDLKGLTVDEQESSTQTAAAAVHAPFTLPDRRPTDSVMMIPNRQGTKASKLKSRKPKKIKPQSVPLSVEINLPHNRQKSFKKSIS